jgi:hypothetical protein
LCDVVSTKCRSSSSPPSPSSSSSCDNNDHGASARDPLQAKGSPPRPNNTGRLNGQQLSNVMWALATLGIEPSQHLADDLRWRAAEVAGELTGHGVSSVLWSFATMGKSPGASLLDALRVRSLDLMAAQRLGGGAQGGGDGAEGFTAQGLSNCIWAYAILGEVPGETLLAALSERARLCEHEFTPQVRSHPLKSKLLLSAQPSRPCQKQKCSLLSSIKHP